MTGRKRKCVPLTRARALELFRYYSDTGALIRKTNRGGFAVGSPAGTVKKKGQTHSRVAADGYSYSTHRVIWLMVTGEWPDFIDHVNHDSFDNRWENLRSVTHKENLRNCSLQKNNSSGITGVRWDKQDKRWVAGIKVNYKKIPLYSGDDFFEAVCRRKSAELKHGFHPNHGL